MFCFWWSCERSGHFLGMLCVWTCPSDVTSLFFHIVRKKLLRARDSQANKTIEDEVSWSFISFFDTRNMVALTVSVLSIEFKLYFNHSSKLSLTTFVNTFIVSTSFSHWDFDGLFDRSQVVSRIYRHHMLFWILIFWKAGASCLRIESNLSWFIMINRMQSVVVHHIFTYFLKKKNKKKTWCLEVLFLDVYIQPLSVIIHR